MKRCAVFLSWIILFSLVGAVVISAKNAEDNSSVRAYILIDADTKTVLEEYNSRERLNVGYLTKLMSLLLIAEDIDAGKYSLNTVVTASESVRGTKGAVIWISPGDKLSVEELLKSVVIGNANDALTVLAENSEGTLNTFVDRMNSKAFDLGLRDSSFFSPYGYFDERELTTAYDIAVICAELTKYEFLTPYFSTWRDHVKDGTVELVSENKLCRNYDKHIGFKAAHSEQSLYCIAEGAKNESGTSFVSVVLGADSDDTSFSKARSLCNKGFSDFKLTMTMFPDEMIAPVKVRKGTEFAVCVGLESQSEIVIPKSDSDLRTVTVLPDFIAAPVRKGQRIGTAGFYNGKTLVYESPVIAFDSVKRLNFAFVFKKMLLNMIE